MLRNMFDPCLSSQSSTASAQCTYSEHALVYHVNTIIARPYLAYSPELLRHQYFVGGIPPTRHTEYITLLILNKQTIVPYTQIIFLDIGRTERRITGWYLRSAPKLELASYSMLRSHLSYTGPVHDRDVKLK